METPEEQAYYRRIDQIAKTTDNRRWAIYLITGVTLLLLLFAVGALVQRYTSLALVLSFVSLTSAILRIPLVFRYRRAHDALLNLQNEHRTIKNSA